MDDHRVDDLYVTWPDNAVIYVVDKLGSYGTKFLRLDVRLTTKMYRGLYQT